MKLIEKITVTCLFATIAGCGGSQANSSVPSIPKSVSNEQSSAGQEIQSTKEAKQVGNASSEELAQPLKPQ